jgi:thioredoxin 1
MEEIRERKVREMLDRMKYPDKPIDIRDGDFDEIIRKYPIMLVDFWAEWCPPCRIVGPVIEELARELQGKVVFGKLDVGSNQSTALKFGITAIPTLLIFREGKIAESITGAVPKEQILGRLRKYIE